MSDIFISYANPDREKAQLLADSLEREGWSVWWDRHIPPGKTFDRVIEQALEAAKCVIVLWSKAAVASEWVKAEAADSMRRGVLVPALIEDVKIPLEFSRVQAADLLLWTGNAADRGFIQLVKAVRDTTSTQVGDRQSSASSAPSDSVAARREQRVPTTVIRDASRPQEFRPPLRTPKARRTSGKAAKRYWWLVGLPAVGVGLILVLPALRRKGVQLIHEVVPGVATSESEPNNEILQPNRVSLEQRINGVISAGGDVDYFEIVSPPRYRDWLGIALRNLSVNLKPQVALWSRDKVFLGANAEYPFQVTAGQNVQYEFVAEPESRFYISVAALEGSGPYAVVIVATKLYDTYEPNDDAFNAASISLGKSLEANIMDGRDVDFYRFSTSSASTRVRILLENRSTDLKPYVELLDRNKVHLWENSNLAFQVTAGQNVEYSFATAQDSTYFIVLGRFDDTDGSYRLTLSEN